MSDKESEREKKKVSSSDATERRQSEPVTGKAIRKIPAGKPGPKCRKMITNDVNERKSSNSGEGESNNVGAGDVPGELEQMFGDLASSPQKKADTPTKVTTENLLSVLEDDGVEKKTSQDPLSKEPAEPTLPGHCPNGSLENKSNVVKPSSKRYVYKLKSKSGKVLKYTSNTPIVLKKPVINLTKMSEVEECGKGDAETDDVDSDNSTKENMKDNDASGDNVTHSARKRGRPPLSQKAPASVSSSDERNSSESAGDKTPSSSSYGVQTRKRQLKFLPDGRLLTPSKKEKIEDKKSDIETASSSGSDVEAVSDNDSDYKNPPTSAAKKSNLEKKVTPTSTPAEKKPAPTKKKVFDIENYIREKTGQSPSREVREQTEKSPLANASNKSSEIGKNKSISSASNNLLQNSPVTPPTKKVTPVDPAQLLSSLIGVPITPSQLNIIKFKPKIIQERSSTAPTPKKVTIDDDKLRKMTTPASGGVNDTFKNTPFKVVSKTTFQKILPKPSPIPADRTPLMRRVEHRIIPATATPLTYAAIAPKMNLTPDLTTPTTNNDSLSKFDNFSDSKVVKTRGGPKKVLKRKFTVDGVGEDSPKTVYDLLQHVFDQMPSWNLHVIPDTNHFCIAQVSRGRMGIPILKKSIELNGDFFAKVYVHQLHCKRYDGVYDTESKILSLIREIDALAA